MKIVFATDNYFPSVGGIEIATRRLAKALSERGNKVYIIAPSRFFGNEEYKDGSLTVFGVRSVLTPVHKYLRYSPSVLSKHTIFKILNQIKPDVIHIQTSTGVAISASEYAEKFNIPNVATNHFMTEDFIYSLKLPMFLRKYIEKKSWLYFKPLWEKADILIAPSKIAADYFRHKSGINKKIIPISNGVETTKFRPIIKKINKVPNIIVVGRIDPAKRVDVVIRAIPDILEKKQVNLLIIGRGSEVERLKGLAKDLGVAEHVFFKGLFDEQKMVELYRNADLLITASEIETEGMAVLEAISSGLPIIAANAGALPELVEDGKNGLLFKPGDSMALAAGVNKILSDRKLSKRMGQESLKIAGRHKIGNITDKFLHVYKKAISKNSLQV